MTSIRLRLLLMLLAMLAVAALLMGLVAYRTVLAETETLFDYQLRQMALSLRDQGEIRPDQARALNNEELDFVVQIWTADGRSIYASRPHSVLPARALLGFADLNVQSEIWRTFSVISNDRVIQVAQPRRIRRQLATEAALNSIAPLVIVAPLLAIVIWWLAAMILRPLSVVAAGVRKRDARSLIALPTQDLPDEIAPLVRALNELLQRLRQALDGQRAFIADAAHELRSPLTALKLQMKVLEQADEHDARSQAQAALGSGIDRTARLVEQLLALARHEPGAPPIAPSRLDLAELARSVMADLVPLAVAKKQSLQRNGETPVFVDGDEAALSLLIRNLVDNAIRHAPAGGWIELTVEEAGGTPTLHVDDAGAGIPAEERSRVFDRFYRRHSTETEGSGLGLAIVRGIAEQHGASVRLDDSPLGGLRVSLLFPAPQFTPGS